jgi:hypothetical protein
MNEEYCQLPIADCQFIGHEQANAKLAIGNWQSEIL